MWFAVLLYCCPVLQASYILQVGTRGSRLCMQLYLTMQQCCEAGVLMP